MSLVNLIPEEIRNAKRVNDELHAVAVSASSNAVFVCANAVILATGAYLGYCFGFATDIVLLQSVMTFCAIIIGFVITSMLFSGRSQHAESLTFEQAQLYSFKSKYMLLSQANTLFSFLFCLGFCVASLISLKVNGVFSADIFASIGMGYLLLGGYRMMLLPYQIYEVHAFSLDHLVDLKELEMKMKAQEESLNRKQKLEEIITK